MMYYLGALVLATYISASAALPPCVCTRDLKPVCGTDGNTYNNECLLDCARTRGKSDLAVQSRGRCLIPGVAVEPGSCICTLEHLPVCGSDGKTYPNECAMDCQARTSLNLVKAHNGECRQKRSITLPESPCLCTMEYRPLCATDGNTYPNRCAMDCQAKAKSLTLLKVHDGQCRPESDITPENDCICTLEYKPVCASDGKSYPNRCAMDCQAKAKSLTLVKVHDGECKPESDVTLPENDCICTLDYKPVCASDGESYPNRCAMDCQSRAKSSKLVKVHDGECRPKSDVTLPGNDCVCTFDYRPLCASDGKTYPNRCAMDCQSRGKSFKLLKVHDGVCRAKRDTDGVKIAQLDPCVCTKEKKPVCGTDGHTYSNMCILRCAKQAKADLDVQHRGSCENVESIVLDIPQVNDPCTCTRNLDPVCATDGQTYPNECRMRCAGAQFAGHGRCDGVVQQVVVAEDSS